MSLLARALCVAFLLTGLGGVPAAQAAPDDWRFLHGDGSLYDGESEFRSILRDVMGVARFSPDGTLLAAGTYRCVGNGEDDCGGFVRIHEPDGGVADTPIIPNFGITGLAWAPDGTAVAVIGQWITPGDTDRRIYRVPIDGGSPTLVFSDGRFLRVSHFGGLSWHPSNGTLAFIGHEDPEGDGFFDVLDSDQVFTVPATGGVPTRYSARAGCAPTGCETWTSFRWPTWSPDGRLAVNEGTRLPGPGLRHRADRHPLARRGLVERAGRGWLHGPAGLVGRRQHAGSRDRRRVGDGYADTRVLDSTSGAVIDHIEGVIAEFADWQPCPSGTCQTWGEVVTRLSVDGVARRRKVIVSGALDPAPSRAASVSVVLHKRTRAGAAWRRVTTVSIPVEDGRYRRALSRPDGVQCRAKATYFVVGPVSPDRPATPGTRPSSPADDAPGRRGTTVPTVVFTGRQSSEIHRSHDPKGAVSGQHLRRDRRRLRGPGPQVRQARPGRLLGRVVRAVPPGRSRSSRRSRPPTATTSPSSR